MSTVFEGPVEGQDTDPPASIIRVSPEIVAEADRALDELDALFAKPPSPPDDGDDDGDGPPTSQSPAPPLSHLALRDDGAILLTLEDAEDRNLGDRPIIRCIALTPNEIASARSEVDNAFAAAAATIIARLPRRS